MRSHTFPARPRPTRHSVGIPCQVVRERDFRLIADRISDLSRTGMLVVPSDPAITGEKLLVSFRSPRWNIWIDAEATVARVVHGRRPGEYFRGLGLQLEGLDPWSKFVLEATLRPLPPAPPGARRSHGRSWAAAAELARRSGFAAAG